jgi:hypothetical protein
MQRRKYLAAIGSMAAAGAAGMGTGAFTSVSANRDLRVFTPDDSDALLALEPEDSPNGDAYVDGSPDALSIDFGGGKNQITDEGAYGVNNEAVTLVREMFRVTNRGTQDVYVWAEGLPEGIRMFHDDDSGANYKTSGAGNNQGAFSDTSNLNPDDPADTDDPQNPGGYEAAPLLQPGDTLSDVGMIIDTNKINNFNFSGNENIVIKAVTPSEL